jgi:hypothetical protein
MRNSSRLVSVVFLQVAVLFGLIALPTVGQGGQPTTYPVLNWIPPTTFPAGTTLESLNTAGKLVAGAKASGTIPMWLCLAATPPSTQCNTTYSYAMVGKNPTVAGSATQIDIRIVPIRFTSGSFTFDPENNDACSPKRTPALNMVQQSPLFKSGIWSPYVQPIGSAQFGSLFQRANFWTYTKTKAVSPNYQVTLAQVLVNAEETAKHTISIIGAIPAPPDTNPANLTQPPYTINGVVQTDSKNWCAPLAMVDVNELDTLLQTQIIPALKGTSGVTPTVVPIFLFSNVAMSYTVIDTTVTPNTSTTYCCILGYHNAYPSVTTGATAGNIQTYIVANYDTTAGNNFAGAFPAAPDLVALANMIAGWMDNPTTLNTTPTWIGTINGVLGPQNTLEVAYPPAVAGVLSSIILSNKTIYHVQELAFKSWFYCDTGSDNSGFGPAYALSLATASLLSPNPACPP